MAPNYYFNFSQFKSTMEVQDADEATFGLILRSIFSYIRRVHSIDLEKSITAVALVGTTESSVSIAYTEGLAITMLAQAGNDYSTITKVTDDLVNNTTTLEVSPAFSFVPANVTIYTTVIDFDLQYAIYLHAKYLLESQKKNAYILDSVTDAGGNKSTYKLKPPSLVSAIYMEHSPNSPAL